MKPDFRIGYGYDIHQLVPGRKFILGNVEIPSDFGPLGHSDADVLLHALTDAILGACALGDIGMHFPDTDPEFKNADSKIFLIESNKLIQELGFEIGNIDATVVLEKPKLRPFIDQIRSRIAELLELEIDRVSVKATTSEKMGFAGRGKGIKAYASVLLFKG